MSTINDIFKEINKAQKIVLLTHQNPDGDAIGSTMAMYIYLKKIKKEVEVIIPSFSKNFENVPFIREAKEIGTIDKYDLAIALDCATMRLLNGWSQYFYDATERIVIDHHSSNSMFGDINYVDPSSPACAQILYDIFKYKKIEIDSDMAKCIITGIITDTGGFQYSGINSQTFEIASEFIEKGINIPQIYKEVLSTHTKTSFELRKIAIDRLEFLDDGKVTFTYITKKDEDKVNAQTGDYEGIVNVGKEIEGVEVSIFLHEQDDGMKASLRSNSYVNVSDVCLMFGGGGHIRAAGATMQGTPEEIKNKILKEVERQLK